MCPLDDALAWYAWSRVGNEAIPRSLGIGNASRWEVETLSAAGPSTFGCLGDGVSLLNIADDRVTARRCDTQGCTEASASIPDLLPRALAVDLGDRIALLEVRDDQTLVGRFGRLEDLSSAPAAVLVERESAFVPLGTAAVAERPGMAFILGRTSHGIGVLRVGSDERAASVEYYGPAGGSASAHPRSPSHPMNDVDAWRHWRAAVGDLPPLGYVLRVALWPRWLRIHALPEPGREATTEEERRIARRRHLTAASLSLGMGAECIAIATTWADETFSPPSAWHRTHIPDALLGDPDVRESLRDSVTSHRTFVWGVGDGEEIVTRVSQATYCGRVVLLSLGTGTVYCPYDGGADIILRSPGGLPILSELLGPWMPGSSER